MSSVLSKEKFKEIGRVKTADFVLESGDVIKCRAMNELERSDYEVRFVDPNGAINKELLAESRRTLIQRCVLTDSGTQMFSESELDQIGQLDSKFAGDLDDFLRDLCGLDQKGTVKAARKN